MHTDGKTLSDQPSHSMLESQREIYLERSRCDVYNHLCVRACVRVSICILGRSVFFSMFLVSFFFFKSMWAGGKKNTKCRKKKHKCYPDPDKHEIAHITPMTTVLGTPDIPTPVGKIGYRDTNYKGSIHSFHFCFCVWIQPHTCVLGLHFSQKRWIWSHCNVCVFVYLPNENQCECITRNIEKTLPGLKSQPPLGTTAQHTPGLKALFCMQTLP